MKDIGDLPPIEEVPAAHLSGRDLGNGWVVGQRVTRDPGASGGAFSVSYTATHVDGREGFLKALNFAAASVGPGTLADRVHRFTAAYMFERDLLLECRNRKLSRVVRMLEHGEARVDDAGFLKDVPYLILELADGDIRAFQSTLTSFDAAWALRVIKHVIEGVEQLHSARAAHQDLKPSNVLTQKSGTEMKTRRPGPCRSLRPRRPFKRSGDPGRHRICPTRTAIRDFRWDLGGTESGGYVLDWESCCPAFHGSLHVCHATGSDSTRVSSNCMERYVRRGSSCTQGRSCIGHGLPLPSR